MTRRFVAVMRLACALAASFVPAASGQQLTLKPGVTVYVSDLGEAVDAMPQLVSGQTPNVSFDAPRAELVGPQGGLGSNLYGEVRGFLVLTGEVKKDVRLSCSGGAELIVDDLLVVAKEAKTAEPKSGALGLVAGRHPLRIRFHHGAGDFRLVLEWRDAGSGDFAAIGDDVLQTEVGLTHVVAPGRKRFSRAGAPQDYPGDARPEDGVHPGYTLENLRPEGFEPRVGALAFLPDGRLVICAWDDTGSVWFMDHLDDPKQRSVHRFADGLSEPLGCVVVDGVVIVSQKQEITKLVDTDGDGTCDQYIAIADGWPASPNYHEFTFNLLHREPYFFVATSVPLKTGLSTYVEGSEPGFPVPFGPGSLFRIDGRTGARTLVADGFRTPNGMCFGPDGDIFVSDNQGSWLPSSRIDHVVEGGFYGHQSGVAPTREARPPVVWLPQNEIGNSPSQPLFMPSGPYQGQMLVGDVTHGGIKRVFLEKVAGEYQGAVVRHSMGLEAGINRLVLGPDGALYCGGIGSNGNWNWNNTKFGLQRLKPNGRTAFEILSVKARANGFLVELTRPVPVDVLTDPAHYLVEQWRYAPTAEYGGPKVDEETLDVGGIEVAPDRQHVFLSIPGLKEGRVVHLRLLRFVDDRGSRMWATEAWYTLNRLPDVAGADFESLASGPRRSPPPTDVAAARDESLAPLFERWPIATWRTVGEASFKIEDGALVGSGTLTKNSFLVSPEPLADFVLETDVWIEADRNSGIQIRSHVNEEGRVYGYQIEIDGSDRAWSGGLYDEGRRGWLQSLADDEAARAAFHPGAWNRYRIECRGARIRSFVNGVPCADYEDTVDPSGFLMFQVHSGDPTVVKWRNPRLEILAP